MNTRQFLSEIAITIPVTFAVAVLVTYLYSLIAHGLGAVDWKAAFDLAFVVGIVLPLARTLSSKAE